MNRGSLNQLCINIVAQLERDANFTRNQSGNKGPHFALKKALKNLQEYPEDLLTIEGWL